MEKWTQWNPLLSTENLPLDICSVPNHKNKVTLIPRPQKVLFVKVSLFFHLNPVLRVKSASEIVKNHISD